MTSKSTLVRGAGALGAALAAGSPPTALAHQVDVFASTDEAHMTILKKQNDATTDIVSGERVVGPVADSLALERKAGGNSINIAFPEDDTILVTAPSR